jgi:hypothetical protein
MINLPKPLASAQGIISYSRRFSICSSPVPHVSTFPFSLCNKPIYFSEVVARINTRGRIQIHFIFAKIFSNALL